MPDAIRFFADQHYPRPVVDGLRRRGIDVLTAQDARRWCLPDADQLAFAANEGRVTLTFDSDYLALHQQGVTHAGIAWCPALKYRIGELVKILQLLHDVVPADEMRNHVEYL